MSRTLAILAVALAACVALAAASVTIRPEHAADEAWTWSHRCSPYDEVNLIFAVRTRNGDRVTERLMEVADPQHPDYTQHMTLEELGELIRDDAAVQTVESWLAPHASVVDRTVNGDFVTAKLVVYEAERMLQTEFHAYTHRDTGKTVFRAATATMPDEVAGAVEYAARVVDFPRRRPPAMSFLPQVFGDAPNGTATPAVLQSFYDMPTDKQTQADTQSASISLFEALGQNFEPASLAAFQAKYGLVANPVAKIIGTNSDLTCVLQPNACGEFELDVSVASLTNGLSMWAWIVASTDETPFIDWAMAMANSTNPPLVSSISYGGDESEEPVALQTRFDAEMQKLGLRGCTVFVASGDDGVAGAAARNDPTKCGFNPSFPATIPHITSVGASQGPEDGKPEVACTSATGGLITTGGGFSNIFPTASWQSSAVQNFLSTAGSKLPPSGMFNSTGRGYPDVALAGHNYPIILNGQVGIGSGTSASTPLFASMVALVNNKRIADGRKPLGFLNPALYQNSNVFSDLTSGENNCAAGPVGHEDCCPHGFTAQSGWDPVTGFGSANYKKFAATFVAL